MTVDFKLRTHLLINVISRLDLLRELFRDILFRDLIYLLNLSKLEILTFISHGTILTISKLIQNSTLNFPRI